MEAPRGPARLRAAGRTLGAAATTLLLAASSVRAQTHDHGMEHAHEAHGAPPAHHAHASVAGMYGPYPLSREASGTAWQPDASLHEGLHLARGPWTLLLHGYADLAWDDQGGPRGDRRLLSDNMAMALAMRRLGAGSLGLRAMLSAEPATVGKRGYPLLLQTGETADGATPLVDRQHPHDLFMELAGAYTLARGDRSAFLYAGLPGEPALGPPAFMHRFSASELPESPIGHHWLDSSHITFGVLTLGGVAAGLKLEGSLFRGREPDQDRWNIEAPKLDSHAFRATWNPAPAWSLQASHGRLESPEQLEPDVDTDRTTVSAMGAGSGGGRRWQAMLAWGRNRNRPGATLDAWLAESAVEIGERHTIAGRIERVRKDELFAAPDPRAGEVFTVGKLSASYRCDFHRAAHLALGVGALGSVSLVPVSLRDAYGSRPLGAIIFVRARVR